MNDNPYARADAAIRRLNRKAVKRFMAMQRRLGLLGFDELNVAAGCKELYTALAADNLTEYKEVAKAAYRDAGEEIIDYLIFELWLQEEIMGKPSPVTHYSYETEVIRKRERLAEALLSSKDRRTEFRRALRYWADMSAQYADIITDEAMLKSYRDQGVEYVRWRTEEDERVCAVCAPRDGRVYPIDKAPPKAHWRCRCWYEPAGM